jgi:hypothetical protein
MLLKLLITTTIKWYVKRTDNKWDDKLFLLASAVVNRDPTENTQKLINELLEELTREK